VPLSELTTLGFLEALWRRISSNAATDRAAQLSYCFVFALFPALFFAVTLAAYLPTHGAVDELLARLGPVMPDEAEQIIRAQLIALTTEQRPHLMTLGLALAVWSASRGVDALRSSLNRSFGVRESRPWWRVQLTAIAVTVATSTLLLLAVAGRAGAGIRRARPRASSAGRTRSAGSSCCPLTRSRSQARLAFAIDREQASRPYS
jgi:membrane protein